MDTLRFVVLVGVLLAGAAADWRTGRVPNALTLPAAAVGLGIGLAAGLQAEGAAGMWSGLGQAALAMAAALALFGLFYFLGGLGGGDVKLMAALGAIAADLQMVLDTTIYALALGMVMALFVMVRRGLVRQTAHRLLGAAMTALARVRPALPQDSPRAPFAVAIAAGGLLAGADHLLGVALPWGAWMG